MKEIQLTQGKLAIVDDDDFEKFSKFNWFCSNDKNRCYALRKITINGKRKTLSLHREIMNVTDPKIEIDHKDGNGLNNQKENLRIATHGENKRNSSKYKKCTSIYKGVVFNKQTNKWRVFIQTNELIPDSNKCKRIHLGYFENEIAAAQAYDAAAIIYYKEFAKLNFPKNN